MLHNVSMCNIPLLQTGGGRAIDIMQAQEAHEEDGWNGKCNDADAKEE